MPKKKLWANKGQAISTAELLLQTLGKKSISICKWHFLSYHWKEQLKPAVKPAHYEVCGRCVLGWHW